MWNNSHRKPTGNWQISYTTKVAHKIFMKLDRTGRKKKGKMDFKMKSIKKDNEGHYIMLRDQYKKRILHLLTYMHPREEHLNT